MNHEASTQTPDLLDTAPLPRARERRLGHYRLQSLLGKGGMGEVYLAQDTQLERKVALKILPAAFTGEADRVRRFAREAKAASGLNHPNILTIHEIGHEQNTHYIATEFIAGTTLRQRLSETRLPLHTVLDIAAQIASALVAAHEAGIIHRDIKPENVMLRTDGLVKVLDFGLAKLAETRSVERGTRNEEADTLLQDNPQSSSPDPQMTDPGTVMGTPNYMSPEQARGQAVDARSDIFSLGVLLYEMIAGRAPFAGVNALDVIGAILHQEPTPLTNSTSDIPAELQRIVTKALRKEREERYQTAKDLLLDVKNLQQELEFAARLKGVQAAEAEATATIIQPAESATREVMTARTISSAKIILGEIKRYKTGVIIGLAALIGCVVLLAYGLYQFTASKTAPFQNVKLTRLTSVGNVKALSVSVSPDGRFIAYAQTEAGQDSLWTKAVATGSAVQIVPPTENELFPTTFSPDGNYIYYVQREGQTSLYQIPVLGGMPKKVLTEISPAMTFSPDGQQFAFLRASPDRTKSQLIVVNADGSGERMLAERSSNEPFRSPSWSPDGKIIAAITYGRENQILKYLLLGIAVESGAVQSLVEPKHSLQGFNNVRWLKDGKGLALIANEKSSSISNYQIWHVSYPGGEVRRITNDLAFYYSLSLTADNSALVADQSESYSNLWITPLSDTSRAQQITRGNHREGLNGVAWTPDGRIVYSSAASGNFALWIKHADGSNARQLPNDSGINPAVSPDGRYLVLPLFRSARVNLWRTDLDGGNLKQLTTGETDNWFDFSPDGRWVIFTSRESGSRKLYKVSIEGGSPVQLNEGPFSRPAVSPDGKWIACLSTLPQSSPHVVILPFEGGAPVKTLAGKFATNNLAPLRWTPDGRALLYVDTRQGEANLWRLPLDGSEPQPVTNFNDAKPERIFSFDLSRDGKQLVIARGGRNADVVLITEVK